AAQLDALTERLGPELTILTETPLGEIERAGPLLLAEAIRRLRDGRALREAGYDGEYGVIRLFEPGEPGRPAADAGLVEPRATPAAPTRPNRGQAGRLAARLPDPDSDAPTLEPEAPAASAAELDATAAEAVPLEGMAAASVLDGLD